MGLKCGNNLDNEFIKSLSTVIGNVKMILDEEELANEYIESLKQLRSEYLEEDFFNAIDLYINSRLVKPIRKKNPVLDRVLSSIVDLKSIIEPKKDTSILDIISEDNSKSNLLDETIVERLERENSKDYALNKYFPLSADARLSFEHRFKYSIILNLFINKSGEVYTMNLSSSDMDNSIKNYLKDLLNIVDKYIEVYHPEMLLAYKSNLTLGAKIEYLKKCFDRGSLTPLSRVDLIKIPNLENVPLKEKLLGYISMIQLMHFDELILSTFGDAINISYNKDYSTNVLENKLKYTLNLGNRNLRTWHDDNLDIDETGEIGSIILLYVESLNLWNGNTETLQKMTFAAYQESNTALSDILKNEKLRSLTIYYQGLDQLTVAGLQYFYGIDGWNNIKSTFKTFGLLFAKARLNPIMFAPVVYAVIESNKDTYLKNKYLVKKTIHSIYKNIFDYSNPNSLLNISLNSLEKDLNVTSNLYGFFNTLFINIESIPYMEYRENVDGGKEVVNLTSNNDNKRLNNLIYSWEGVFNITIPLKFRSFCINDFTLNEENKPLHLLIGIGGTSFEDCDIQMKLTGTSKGSVNVELLTKNGLPINLENLNPLLLDFLSEVFGFKVDKNFIDIYKLFTSNLQVKDIFDVAGTILYNYKVGKTINAKTLEDYNNKIKEYYNGTEVRTSRGSLLPELIPNSEYLKVLNISLVKDYIQGFSGERTARDGEGKLIFLKGLSQLMSNKYIELAYNHNFIENSLLGEDAFLIYKLYRGVEFVRDFNGLESKLLATKFSENEFYAGSFIYDLYDGISFKDDNDKVGEISHSDRAVDKTFIRIFGPVISDKNKLPKILIHPLDKVYVPGVSEPVYVKDLTADQIKKVLKKEFGDFYYGVHENILSEYEKLNSILPTVVSSKYKVKLPIGLLFNYDNDFLELNQYVLELNALGKQTGNTELETLTAFDLLHDCIAHVLRQLLTLGTTFGIKIVEGLSYIKDKKGFLHNNPSLYHLLSIYGRPILNFVINPNLKFTKESLLETPEQERRRHNLLLILELLSNETELKVTKSLDKANDIAAKRNADYLVGHHIAFAKIMLGTSTEQNIIAKDSFLNWSPYKNLIKLFGEELPDEININSPLFRIDKTLEFINKARFLRTILLKEIKENILSDSKKRTTYFKYFNQSPELVIELKLREKNPYWGEEAVNRHVLLELEGKSAEEIKTLIAGYAIDEIVNETIKGNNIRGYSNKIINDIKSIKDNTEVAERLKASYDIQINPEIEKHNFLTNWVSESFLLTSVGTFIAHPGNSDASSIFNYEESLVGQQIKRNVSLTAAKHRELLNALFGIGDTIRYIVAEEDRDSFITYKGDYNKKGIKTDDGATYYNMFTNPLSNNSLGADAMGKTKKPFIHSVDALTGTVVVIKTAGYVITNQSIREGNRIGQEGRDALINRHLNDTIKWTDVLNKHGINGNFYNYLQKYDGTLIQVEPWYYYDKERKTWVKRSNLRIDENGITTYDEIDVFENGQEKNYSDSVRPNQGNLVINSNYQLWLVFGGEWSGHLENGKLTCEEDESSTNLVLYIMNNAGIQKGPFKNAKIKTLENVLQVLKESMLHLWVTLGSIKTGPMNINSRKVYSDSNYLVTWMESNSSDLGEQLDAEHDAEGGHVALMTLVMNALAARGFSREAALECYEALEAIILLNFEEGFEGLYKYTKDGDSSDLKIFIYNLLFKTLKNVSLQDGNILTALALEVKNLNITSLDDLDGKFAFSDPRVFSILQSKIASSIEKSVRLKMEGGQYIMTPSNGRVDLIGNSISGRVSELKLKSLQLSSNRNPLLRSSQIRFGRTYFVGGQKIKVDEYSDFWKVKLALLSGANVVEAFLSDSEGNQIPDNEIKGAKNIVSIHRDLATYECIFYGKASNEEENEYTLWETDIVRELHTFDKNTNKFTSPVLLQEQLWNRWLNGELLDGLNLLILNDWLKRLKVPYTTSEDGFLTPTKSVNLKPYLRHYFLETLNAIGSGALSTVEIDGQTIFVNKSRTKTFPYEAILPMIYKSEFGLRKGDLVNDISEDKYFFVKRGLELRSSKLPPQLFDLELKTSNGKHIYLHYAGGKPLIGGAKVLLETAYENGVLFRTENGKKLYLLPNSDVEIFKIGNVEVISTKNITEFLNQFNYDSIHFGKVKESYLGEVFNLISNSTNKVAESLTNRVINLVKTRILNHQLGLKEGKGNNELKILVDKGLSESILNIDTETINKDFISLNPIAINELYNSDLISSGLAEYEEGIKSLLNTLEKLQNDLLKLEVALTNLLEKYPYLTLIIKKGKIKHTSFLESLLGIVSRTPAQCHLSFMTMQVAGFDQTSTNSIYVSRMLIYLLGSDYDIDKDNVLGLKFLNGEMIDWSPFFDLSSIETATISEGFPFPTGRKVLINTMTRRAFDVNERNYDTLLSSEAQIVVRDSKGNTLSAIKSDSGQWLIDGEFSYDNIRAILEKIPKGEALNLEDNEALGIKDGINTREYNLEQDFLEYLNSLEKTNDKKYSLASLISLVRTANKLEFISPTFKNEINLIDRHNLYLKGRAYWSAGALHNFISIKARNISKDPVNLIQGQSGVDEAVDEMKEAVNPNKKALRTLEGKKTFDRLSSIPITSDPFTIMAKIRSLILTLSGKQNTGIVASAMKTFEAMSQYFYNILAIGTEEEQEALLGNIKINGKQFELLANSYVKNSDSLKSEAVRKALEKVNNLEDAFLLMSALLSLSTDNAKDPTLSKYNAGPEMIGIYLAGIIVGVDMDTLCDLAISDTGILLSKLQKGNVFDEDSKKYGRLSSAINYLLSPPRLNFYNRSEEFKTFFKHLAVNLGLISSSEKISSEVLESALRSYRFRGKMKLLASIILKPDAKKIQKTDEQIIRQTIRDIKNDPDYYRWKNLDSKKRLLLLKLKDLKDLSSEQKEKLQKLLKEEEEYNKLNTLLTEYQKLLKGEQSKTASLNLQDLKKLLEFLANEKTLKDLKSLVVEDESLKQYAKDIFDWIEYREVIDNDKVYPEESFDGEPHTRIYEIRKLNYINEEMGELRKVLALNQGLPNLVLDLINWIKNFRIILENAVLRKGLKEDHPALERLKTLNLKLRENKKIHYESDLLIDLNSFLNDPLYLQAVILAYEAAKQFVNIMKVMANIPHYRGYLKAMNLVYEGSKAASVTYKELAKISDWILPKLNIRDSVKALQFLKVLTPTIFRKLNNDFLASLQEKYRIPVFEIKDGELIEEFEEDGSLKFRTIKLGSEKANRAFCDWVVNYLYPYLKSNYADNAFVKAITLRTYKFNPDHNLTVNIAKILSYNLKDPLENVAFNEIKQGLQELNAVKLADGQSAGIATALYYYNLIAYNGLPGLLALTDLFEDLIAFDLNEKISSYSIYLRERDKSEREIFSAEDEDLLMRLLAPTVTGFENVSLYPYSYIVNPETNKYVLVLPNVEPKNLPEDSDIPDDILGDILALEAELYSLGFEGDLEGFGKIRKGISWKDLLKKLGIKEVGTRKSLDSEGAIIFSKFEVVSDIFTLVSEVKDPLKTILDHEDTIILNINGVQKTLSEFFSLAKENGWSKKECLDIFLIIPKKRSNGLRYNTLDLDILLHGLKLRNDKKPKNC